MLTEFGQVYHVVHSISFTLKHKEYFTDSFFIDLNCAVFILYIENETESYINMCMFVSHAFIHRIYRCQTTFLSFPAPPTPGLEITRKRYCAYIDVYVYVYITYDKAQASAYSTYAP